MYKPRAYSAASVDRIAVIWGSYYVMGQRGTMCSKGFKGEVPI